MELERMQHRYSPSPDVARTAVSVPVTVLPDWARSMASASRWPAPVTMACIAVPSRLTSRPAYRAGAAGGPTLTWLRVIATPPATAGPLITIRSRADVPDVAAMVTVRSPLAGPFAMVTVPSIGSWNGGAGKADCPERTPLTPPVPPLRGSRAAGVP